MRKVITFSIRAAIDIAFLFAAYYVVKYIILNGEEPSYLVLFIAFFVGVFFGEIIFLGSRKMTEIMMLERSCVDCKHFLIEQYPSESNPAVLRCKHNGEIVPNEIDKIYGFPKKPAWCPEKDAGNEK